MLKRTCLYCLLALLAPGGAALSAGQINFVYPPEGLSIPSVAKTFIFGNISPSTAAFFINGERIGVHSNGAFIAYLPVTGGDFVFNGLLDDGTMARRLIKVRQPSPQPSTGTLSLEFTSYAADTEAMIGEHLKISAAGTPDHEAVCSLDDVFDGLRMTELPPGSGKYYATYRLKEKDLGKKGALKARFKAGIFGRGASARSAGQVQVTGRPVLVETSTDTVILRNAPDGGYMMFLPKGVKLVADGRANGQRRIALSAGDQGWVDESKVQPVSGADFPFAYGSETGAIRLTRTPTGSSAALTLYDRLPYTAEAMPWGLRLTLYYANLRTNWVVYDTADTLVKNVAFRQAGAGRVEIDFETGPGELWGYEVSYPNNSRALQVELRAKPKAELAWPKPLSGVTVVLDAGHSVHYKCRDNKRVPMREFAYSAMPEGCYLDGAVGPLGTFEVNVNLDITQKLKTRLEALGAAVKLTRAGEENVELADRPKLARDLGGDLFISVHNNAIGDGEDPFGKPRGFSFYYYHRHSRDLAAALHRSFVNNIPLPDEGLRYGDYLVARLTWMPSVLVENAYMIIPRQEEMLNNPGFQDLLAEGMALGVLDFFGVPPRSAGGGRGKK
jgi:N-acetylmuramoyl-L-alanine amidase